jgi:chromatin remodeling complex protein RSC6
MAEDDTDDSLEITQCRKTIVSQQYVMHMAESRIAARNAWRAKQALLAAASNKTEDRESLRETSVVAQKNTYQDIEFGKT